MKCDQRKVSATLSGSHIYDGGRFGLKIALGRERVRCFINLLELNGLISYHSDHLNHSRLNVILNISSKMWVSRLAPYKIADNRRACLEIATTIVPFAAIWFAIWKFAQLDAFLGYLMAALLVIIAGALNVRLFIIQHDCGHGSMFSSKKVNDWVGRALGVITLTPYGYWKNLHASHHASSGNLDRRGMGDIDTLTVREYVNTTKRSRLRYRLYRHPFVMFVVGPAFLFMLGHRLPVGAMTQGRRPWISALATNAVTAIFFAAMIYAVGLSTFLLIHLPIVSVGASIGVWLFYVQHQFEKTHWDKNPDWDHTEAALNGSSYYDLPKPFMWLTGNIGIHHVHHLSSRIPFHKLPEVLKDYPELKDVGRITFWQSIQCIRLVLWDEDSRRLVSFRDIDRMNESGVA